MEESAQGKPVTKEASEVLLERNHALLESLTKEMEGQSRLLQDAKAHVHALRRRYLPLSAKALPHVTAALATGSVVPAKDLLQKDIRRFTPYAGGAVLVALAGALTGSGYLRFALFCAGILVARTARALLTESLYEKRPIVFRKMHIMAAAAWTAATLVVFYGSLWVPSIPVTLLIASLFVLFGYFRYEGHLDRSRIRMWPRATYFWSVGRATNTQLLRDVAFGEVVPSLTWERGGAVLAEGEYALSLMLDAAPSTEITAEESTPYFVFHPARGLACHSFTRKGIDLRLQAPLIEAALMKIRPALLPLIEWGREMDAAQTTVREAHRRSTEAEAEIHRIRSAAERWKGIFLRDTLVAELLATVDLFKSADPAAPNGMLLKGPPGTGKTLLAKRLSEAAGIPFIASSAAELKSNHIGGTEENIKKLFERARAEAPCILFVDECNGIMADRNGTDGDQFAKSGTETFLACWQGFEKEARILVIGATNRPEMLDGALRSRFGVVKDISLPDAEGRQLILARELRLAGMDEGFVTQEAIDASAGMSGRDLMQAASQTKVLALAEGASPAQRHLVQALGVLRGRGSKKVSGKDTWETLAVPEATRSELVALAHMLTHAEEIRRQGFSVPKGALFHGPPGTGKTKIARTLATETKLYFEVLTLADLKGRHEGETAPKIAAAFQRAREMAPAIVYIDEVDTVTPARGSYSGGFTNDLLNQLLQELDGADTEQKDIFLVASTNRMDQVDPAMLRRLPKKVHVPLPDTASRERVFLLEMGERRANFDVGEAARQVAAATEGLSGADIANLVSNAEIRLMERATAAGSFGDLALELSDLGLDRIEAPQPALFH